MQGRANVQNQQVIITFTLIHCPKIDQNCAWILWTCLWWNLKLIQYFEVFDLSFEKTIKKTNSEYKIICICNCICFTSLVYCRNELPIGYSYRILVKTWTNFVRPSLSDLRYEVWCSIKHMAGEHFPNRY